jgi:hypothetical protein
MSIWTDARDNIRGGVSAAWKGLPETGRALLTGVAIGFALGAITVALWVS